MGAACRSFRTINRPSGGDPSWFTSCQADFAMIFPGCCHSSRGRVDVILSCLFSFGLCISRYVRSCAGSEPKSEACARPAKADGDAARPICQSGHSPAQSRFRRHQTATQSGSGESRAEAEPGGAAGLLVPWSSRFQAGSATAACQSGSAAGINRTFDHPFFSAADRRSIHDHRNGPAEEALMVVRRLAPARMSHITQFTWVPGVILAAQGCVRESTGSMASSMASDARRSATDGSCPRSP
jgi:hypothetical protein